MEIKLDNGQAIITIKRSSTDVNTKITVVDILSAVDVITKSTITDILNTAAEILTSITIKEDHGNSSTESKRD